MAKHGAFAAALVVGLLAAIPAAVESIGVCYGVNGDRLPSASEVVQLYKSNGITGMRVYNVNDNTRPEGPERQQPRPHPRHRQHTAQCPRFQRLQRGHVGQLVKANVQSQQGLAIKYIAVGNEVPNQGGNTADILPAMKNIQAALVRAGLGGIKVSTAVHSGVTQGFPPSQGTFSAAHMPPIAQYLASIDSPLLANIYPYISFKGTPSIDIKYALFTAPGTVVTDGRNSYQNLFDALIDTMYSALESAGAGSVPIVVSESGWPSAGDLDATAANARTYNQNLINHVGKGDPKKPGAIEAYIFAMFNENLKGGLETEKHFGLFNADKSPAYSINF
uniref:Glu1 protein n=1 Tax=Festuca pratensis TaxID=4608 RepID=Q949H8_FESPR|nr:Glu1 protein [Festuca pratensis]